jgi:hypothetical protein
MKGHLPFEILDTVYRKIYTLKRLIVSSLFLPPSRRQEPPQKTLDKPGPLAYKKKVALDTVYKISKGKMGVLWKRL